MDLFNFEMDAEKEPVAEGWRCELFRENFFLKKTQTIIIQTLGSLNSINYIQNNTENNKTPENFRGLFMDRFSI